MILGMSDPESGSLAGQIGAHGKPLSLILLSVNSNPMLRRAKTGTRAFRVSVPVDR